MTDWRRTGSYGQRCACLFVLGLSSLVRSQDVSSVCYHEDYANVHPQAPEIRDGETVYREIRYNMTHRWFYRNEDVNVMNRPDQYRKVIVNLEPCRGVVYLFVRKTRRCYPDPYSCIDIRPGFERREAALCEWTHFVSEIDGSRDGSPTFFELPLSSTKHFISVYAPEDSAYTLTILADIGRYPRPGSNGRITARQLTEMQVQLSWDAAEFIPAGVAQAKQYWVYSSMLLESDNRTNMAVFLRPDKIMNTVCGLQNNTDRQYTIVPADQCSNGKCNVTIDGVITDKRYVFNIVAESTVGDHRMAYAGLIMRTDWEVIRQAASDRTLAVVGAVSGSVLGMVIIIYFLMLKLYG
ncbi:unnamed protein product [Symbiodinium natans]|uniref:Uncharacterized protein n=1 Tax=Symbiodinium natans TaxID=878477 RepID=A0A812JUX3_9DINO|nr:unnamed protein product [Symbiodinium natans]